MAIQPIHPLFGIVLDILILSGTVLVGQKLLMKLVRQSNVILSLGLGVVLISQALYISILIKPSLIVLYITSLFLVVCGMVFFLLNFKIISEIIIKCNFSELKKFFNPVVLLSSLLIIAYLLLSFGPPTNADGLHYHWGIPVYLMRHLELPPTNLWLHGSQGGVGEVFNTLGMIFSAEKLGTILQSSSLIAFCFYLANRYNFSKRYFLYLFILSSPVLLFLVTTPKYQLFPEVLTAIALFLTVSKTEIDTKNFFIICCLLMGAAQLKLSFVLTGGVIGLWALWKTPRNKTLILFVSLMCFIFFFFPKAIWNFEQTSTHEFLTFFTAMPPEYLENLHTYRENNLWFPLNLFVPTNFGKATTVVGFQVLLVLLVRTKNKKFWEAIILTFIAILTVYFFGMSVGRAFYEFVLWVAVAFSFLPEEDFKFRLYNKYLLVQAIVVLCGSAYGVYNFLPGAFSGKQRQEVMDEYAWEHSAATWVNEVLPEKSVVISGLRSVALLSHDFIPTDWPSFFPLTDTVYYDAISLKKPNFLIAKNKTSIIGAFGICVGDVFAGPKSFNTATRNPYSKGNTYSLTIYHFDASKLKYCRPGQK